MTGPLPQRPHDPQRPHEPEPLPDGFRVVLDAAARRIDDRTWFGGSPARVIRLTPRGQQTWDELFARPVASPAAGALGRRLTDSGLAHPRPPAGTRLAVGVVVPVRDRVAELGRCLSAQGRRHPVVVVDDGSSNPDSVAAVASAQGAQVVRRHENGGAAAARNTGLAAGTSDLVAFLDSDCIPPQGWIERLAGHFADPLVAAVAPRITDDHGSAAHRYPGTGSGLDLGRAPARVVPGTRVAYVQTAALVVRRAALAQLACPSGPFDPALRIGEDVDLIWRLDRAGWRIRYEPSVEVRHTGATSWSGLLARRYTYGCSAGPLAVRHPANLAPLVLSPWPALTMAGLLARSPLTASGGFAGYLLTTRRHLIRHQVSTAGLVPSLLSGVQQTWLGTGRYVTQFAAPLLAAGLLRPGGSAAATRWGRRAALASLVLGPPLHDWASRRRPRPPARFVTDQLAAQVSYGAGVWAGCLQSRTLLPLLPAVNRGRVLTDPQNPAEPITHPTLPVAGTRAAAAAGTRGAPWRRLGSRPWPRRSGARASDSRDRSTAP